MLSKFFADYETAMDVLIINGKTKSITKLKDYSALYKRCPSVRFSIASIFMIFIFYPIKPLRRRYDMKGRSQMQGGKNWFLPKEINANRFFRDSQWLKIW
jgi:hypothetical protein